MSLPETSVNVLEKEVSRLIHKRTIPYIVAFVTD